MSTHMWYNDVAFDDHQIVHRYTRPISPTPVAFASQVGANLSRSLEEQPYVFALLEPDHTARHILPIVEHEGNHEFSSLYGFLDLQVLPPQLVFELDFLRERRLGHDLGMQPHGRIWSQALLYEGR